MSNRIQKRTIQATKVCGLGAATGGTLRTWQIAIFICAAAAPLGAVVGTGPIGIIFGNGIGVPGMFLIAGVIMTFFGIGYAALIRALPGEGAFYRYISAVFGPSMGNGAAMIALLSYWFLSAALCIGCAAFTEYTLVPYGLKLGMSTWAFIYLVVVGVLGRSAVELAVKVVVPMVVLEFVLLLGFIVASAFHKGFEAFPVESISPNHVFAEGGGVSIMIAIACFIGVESAALYSGEAKNPDKAVPRATLIAISFVAIIYFLSIWAAIGDLGIAKIAGIEAAGRLDTELQQGLILQLFGKEISFRLEMVVSLLMITSTFACYVALHNAGTRYLPILAEHGLMPRHFVTGSRANIIQQASLVTTIVELAAVLLVAFGHLSYFDAFTPLYALGTIGVLILQALVALATLCYFLRRRGRQRQVTLIAPSVAFAGFVIVGCMISKNYPILAGSSSSLVLGSPLIYLVALLACFVRRRGIQPLT